MDVVDESVHDEPHILVHAKEKVTRLAELPKQLKHGSG